MVDFNKKNPTYSEYREIAHKILLKYYKYYEKDLYYANDMIDFVVDKLIKKEKYYDSSQSSRSQYRYMVSMLSAKNYYLQLSRERKNLRKIDVEEYEEIDNIDIQEKNRLYGIAMHIIESRLSDVKYKCFYDSVINEIPLKTIANRLGKTPTTIMNNVNKVKKQLRHTLVEVYGAEF